MPLSCRRDNATTGEKWGRLISHPARWTPPAKEGRESLLEQVRDREAIPDLGFVFAVVERVNSGRITNVSVGVIISDFRTDKPTRVRCPVETKRQAVMIECAS